MATLTLIDTSGFVYRAYYALPAMTLDPTDPTSQAVNALYGYTKVSMALARERFADDEPHYVAAVFDGHRRGADARSALDPQYKANRKPLPPELSSQFPLVREAAAALGLNPVVAPGVEADDLIATYAHEARAAGMDVCVLSSDKDLFFLLARGCTIWDPLKAQPITDETVRAKFGVDPALVPEVLALMGDASDNIPGVAGIGAKTAAALVQRFGTVDNVLANAHDAGKPKIVEALRRYADAARTSRKLVELRTDVPLPMAIPDLDYKRPGADVLQAFLERFRFVSLMDEHARAAA